MQLEHETIMSIDETVHDNVSTLKCTTSIGFTVKIRESDEGKPIITIYSPNSCSILLEHYSNNVFTVHENEVNDD